MAGIDNMNKAKDAKNDEFYTQLSDIEKELKHYKNHFKGKTVFCNCDDPEWSHFWKYFHLNFEHLGLKKLITTHYDASEPTYMMTYEGGGDIDTSVGKITPLKQNGDFRSPECIELLKSADIVVTNPPFSLFREYLNVLLKYEKNFIIIGNINALHYKEIFPLIQDNIIWLGYGGNIPMIFRMPDSYPLGKSAFIGEDGAKYTKMGSCCWFTNLDIQKRHEVLDLVEHYDPEKYPKYDNYDAIEVNKVLNIPVDYDGVMGVPDSFLDSYNPDQFIIVGSSQTGCHPDSMVLKKYKDYKGYKADGTSNGRTGSTCGNNPMLTKNDGKHAYYMNDEGHIVQSTFSRIFIKRKGGNNL